ncbi:MAG: PAAR domain-containing protein [Planctomycetes bacterium]|nr:PAAR domain-containing protein [Planctomycetota bacterium]
MSPASYACVGGQAKCDADVHGCPACPHIVVGPITTGSPLVLVGGKPAARVGDKGTHAACCGSNTFEITSGDDQVLIDGRPAAKLGTSLTKHCGGDGKLISTGH